MVLKNVLAAFLGALLLVCSGAATADDYRPDQFLGLDLSKAVLSPKRLGPSTEFTPVAVEANTDRGNEPAPALAETTAKPDSAVPRTRMAHLRTEHLHAQPRGTARTRLAHRHSNPLDAQAFDTRIQVWPCRSGGICNWKR